MLQPRQLEELAVRHTGAVRELRGFLTKAGVATEVPSSLHVLNETLRQNRALHRDLTSHLWVLMEEGVQQSSTLLGVLAVAAVGPELATEAGTEDAHALLRFVLEARRSFGISAESEARTVPVATAEKQLAPGGGAAVRSTGSSVSRSFSHGSHRALWAVVACLLAVGGGLWLWLRPSSPVRTIPAPIVNTPPATAANTPSVKPSPVTANPEVLQTQSRTTPAATRAGASRTHSGIAAVAPAQPTPNNSGTPQAIASAIPAQRPASTALAAGLGAIPSGNGAPIPTAVLSRRLGSPTIPAYASTGDEAVSRKHPRLLRRPPLQENLRDSSDDPLLAEADTADAPSASSPGRAGNAHAVANAGVVRPASLGTMGANAMYTPVPPYPAAASAAKVQGEVRIQARIDPGGNVASARVISGPPLLRDAALNAVQHWRYKPYMASGRPSAASAIAVVDFELP